jgi:hypothetical protein
LLNHFTTVLFGADNCFRHFLLHDSCF